MSDQGSVSTEETPQDEGSMNVVTEENGPASQVDPQAKQQAAPPKDGESDEESSASSKDDPPKDGETKAKRPRKRSAERKIAALQRKLTEAEEAGNARDQEIASLRAEIAELKKAPPAAPKPKPKLQDFKSAEEYGAAYAEWLAEQNAAEPPKDEKPAAATPPSDPPKGDPPANPEVEELADKGAERYGEEFEEVLYDNTLPLSANMADYVFDSEHGPDLIMWIDEHREEARDLFHMRPRKLARELDKIVAGFESESPPADDPPKREQKRGEGGRFARQDPDPPPGDPVRGDGPNVDQGIKEGLSMDDYAKKRRAQMNAHRVR